MNKSLTKVVLNLLKRPKYWFSKPKKERNYDQRYPKPLAKEEPEKKSLFDLQKIDIAKDDHIKQLIFTNIALVAAIPLWMPFNVAFVLFNGGFIISQTGHQLKHFLLLVNNNRLDQLNQFPKPSNLLKIVLIDSVMISVISTLLAYNFFSTSILLTGGWYGYKIFTQSFHDKYLVMGIPILFALMINAGIEHIEKAQLNAANEIVLESNIKEN